MSRRLLAAVLAGAAGLALGVTPAPAGADDPAPLPASAIALASPDRVTASAWRGRVWTDFGLRLDAGSQPFEIWSTRPSYGDQISSVWRSPGGDVPLPAGSMTDFAGLDGFADITITRPRSGEVVKRIGVTVCFNGWSGRVHPDAPARSPYPMECPWNPYTLGSVMGIQTGWSIPMSEAWDRRPVRLEAGRYRVTASIADTWTAFFGISEADASTSTLLVVEDEEIAERGTRPGQTELARPATRAPRTAAAGDPVAETAPDLRSLPAFGIALNQRGTAIRFAATVWNGGLGPVVVDGFPSSSGDHLDAYQYFYDTAGNEVGHQRVGEFAWHDANHRHWHFLDFARYRLVTSPDPEGAQVVRSTKVSFCLANTDMVDYTIPNADWRPDNTDLHSACGGSGATSLRQVLSNGSGDTYLQYRAGQAFRIGDVPDGVYWIAVEANPFANLVESDATNNTSYRRIRLGTRTSGKRFVRVPQVGIVEELDLFGER